MKRPSPEIIENYKDFNPPWRIGRVVQSALEFIPAEDLKGMSQVILTNSAALSRDERRKKSRYIGRKVRLGEAFGFYHWASDDGPAHVTILVDRILEHRPNPIMQFWDLAHTLFHEVGHHVQTVRRDPRRQREHFANDYADGLTPKFIVSRPMRRHMVVFLLRKTWRHPIALAKVLFLISRLMWRNPSE